MKSYGKKPGKEAGKKEIVQKKVAGKIFFGITKLQTAFARLMDKKVNRYSVKKRRYFLYIFCIPAALYFLFLMATPFLPLPKVSVLRVDNIKMPIHTDKTGELKNNEEFITKEEYNNIHSFKIYMDSLSKDSNGKKIYDSILLAHPKLMDSINMIEEFYQFQK